MCNPAFEQRVEEVGSPGVASGDRERLPKNARRSLYWNLHRVRAAAYKTSRKGTGDYNYRSGDRRGGTCGSRFQ